MTFIDSFSGSIVDIPKRDLTDETALVAITNDPKISTFDMSERPDIRIVIKSLMQKRKIKEVVSEYPWHRYEITS